MKKKLVFSFISIIIIFFFSIYFLSGKGYSSFLANFLSNEQINSIKKIALPYKYIAEQEKLITENSSPIVNLELDFKSSKRSIDLGKMKAIELANNLILNKYNIVNGFYAGINNTFPGSGFVDFHENNFFILSSRGIIAYSENLETNQKLIQIDNNIQDFINKDQFSKYKWFSIKDLLIHNNKILISYTEEIKTDCWNTSIIWADINYSNIVFEKLFSNKNCIISINNPEGEFNAHQSGGRIVNIDENNFLLTVGDYRNRYHAQNTSSLNGKILKINTSNSSVEIFTMGHRNPQGLLYDKENNFILSTEHGPQGGDEINIIKIYNKDKEIQNFGWPIVSDGEHYGGRERDGNEKKYKKYPLHKSHSKYGFIEPLKSFVPSIGISEIVKINNNQYIVSSLGGRSLYIFKINKDKEIIDLNKIEIFERVRDMLFKNNKIYLFLEDTASIGIIDFKK